MNIDDKLNSTRECICISPSARRQAYFKGYTLTIILIDLPKDNTDLVTITVKIYIKITSYLSTRYTMCIYLLYSTIMKINDDISVFSNTEG